MLYHGTVLSGLQVIQANSKSHSTGKLVAYFSEDRCYALVCCRSSSENFVTMGLRDDGKQHYYERFPNQLQTLYGGRQGCVYVFDHVDGARNTKGRTWEIGTDVPVQRCERIDDVYAEILREEKNGNIVIHRYSEIDPAEQKLHANYIKSHLDEAGEEMKQFYIAHFSMLWDSCDQC